MCAELKGWGIGVWREWLAGAGGCAVLAWATLTGVKVLGAKSSLAPGSGGLTPSKGGPSDASTMEQLPCTSSTWPAAASTRTWLFFKCFRKFCSSAANSTAELLARPAKGGGDLVELRLTIDSGAGGEGCITLGINRCKGKGMSDGEWDAIHPFNFVAKRLYGAGFSEITVRHCSFNAQYHGRDAALP